MALGSIFDNGTLCTVFIRVLDKLNLSRRFDFRLEPILDIVPVAQKHFSLQKWSKMTHFVHQGWA